MLGGQQSGHIEAVGFEMYTTMLEQAVKELKGEGDDERAATQLNLGIALRIEENYVPEENQRLRLYKKIAGATTEDSLVDVRAELQDRYGPLPDHTVHLLEASRLRIACERVGVAQLDRKRDLLHLRFTEKAAVDPERLMRIVARNARKGAQFTPQGILKFPLSGNIANEPMKIMTEARALLDAIQLEAVPA
jgi:transcription-repair coupling factor (superfamily II helicase)